MKTIIRDTILDGNMGEGWTDQYSAALAFAERLNAAYRAEFGDDSDVHIDVRRNTSGETPRAVVQSDDDNNAETRADYVISRTWEEFCGNPPAELVA